MHGVKKLLRQPVVLVILLYSILYIANETRKTNIMNMFRVIDQSLPELS